ncbi:MAG: hypothetical protein V2A58_13240 [Planctomycetota bacterium]
MGAKTGERAPVIQVLFVVVFLSGILLAARVGLGGGSYVLAGACVLAAVGLAVGIWKLSQKARAITLLALMALLVYAALGAWEAFGGAPGEGVSAVLRVVSVGLVATDIVGITLILHPAVRREFIGNLSELAKTRQRQEEIWGLKEELARREEAERGRS